MQQRVARSLSGVLIRQAFIYINNLPAFARQTKHAGSNEDKLTCGRAARTGHYTLPTSESVLPQ